MHLRRPSHSARAARQAARALKVLMLLCIKDRRGAWAYILTWREAASLLMRNLLSRQSVIGLVPATVSMTTYGDRFATVHLALESIGRGKARPEKVVLWIDDPALFANPTRGLQRLVRRGLQVRQCPNYGPHKKQFPYATASSDDNYLVTADDDVMYPSDWLAGIDEVVQTHPDSVVAYRAHRMTFEGDSVLSYSQWPAVVDCQSRFTNFATGVSGVAYPPAVLRALAARGTQFMKVAPRADDIWMHNTALAAGVPTRQVSQTGAYYRHIPFTQHSSLFQDNVAGLQNDVQIKATYSALDLETLARSR